MVDFEQKMNDILSDYYSTIGRFMNVSETISLNTFKIKDNDDEETKKVKEGQQREILIDLGRVAEMAFKYIIKIRRMELYPNEPYLDTVINGNIVKGFKEKETLTAAVIRDLGNKVHASQEDIDSVLNVSGIGPKAHNFNYLYSIVDKLMPDVKNKLNEVIGIKFKSNNIANVFDERNLDEQYVVFPNESLKTHADMEKERIDIINLINSRIQTIEDSGDIFTRLRYFANNPFDKKFSIEDVYDMLTDIVLFIKLIHLSHDNLHFNPEIAFSFYTLKNNPSYARFSIEDIKKIYSHDKVKDNTSAIMDAIFYSGKLTIDEIIKILDCDQIDVKDYTYVFVHSLNLETIFYFRSIGIEDYEDMALELRRKTPDVYKHFANIFSDEYYTLDEYRVLRDKFDGEKYPGILFLLNHLSEDSLTKLMNYPDVLTFFISELYPNVRGSSYQYGDTYLFKKLLEVKEVRENFNAWFGLDLDQLEIYWGVSEMLLENPINEDIVNRGNYYIGTIMNNVRENIEYFKKDPKLLAVMPLMLDFDDNKYILDKLVRNGLKLDNLRGFDSTILCLPPKLVDVIESILTSCNIPLIIGNKVNPVVMELVSMISGNSKKKKDIRNRRVPFYNPRLKEENRSSNVVINELSYDNKDEELILAEELKDIIKPMSDIIKGMDKEELTLYFTRLLYNSSNTKIKH